MKQQIDKLVGLAEEYVEYGKEVGVAYSWTYLRHEFNSERTGKEISIYRDKAKNWAVKFTGVEVAFYSGIVSFPYSCTPQELEEIYRDAKIFLETIRVEDFGQIKAESEKKRIERITELEDELKQLKGE